MGYSRLDGDEETILEMLLKKPIDKIIRTDYPYQVKSLLRKKMIQPKGKTYIITARGKSAVNQQIKLGEYWLSPLKPKKYNPNGGSLKIPRSLAGYVR